MPIPFIAEEYIKWKDIERSPYTWKQFEYIEWSRKDDERLLLIALDRYASRLKNDKEM